jgi:hypothetical protein
VETDAAGLGNLLDVWSGIDAWQIFDKSQRVRAIAARMQHLHSAPYFESFTLRYQLKSGCKTEYQKRLEDVLDGNKGWLSPHLMVQAYFKMARDKNGKPDYGALNAFNICRMHDLISCIAYGRCGRNKYDLNGDFYFEKTSPKHGQYDGHVFIVVPNKTLLKHGYKVRFKDVRPDPGQ